MPVPLLCPQCGSGLPVETYENVFRGKCVHCRSDVMALACPAAFHERVETRLGQLSVVDSDAVCFFHEKKKAEFSCNYCGRFMCALCEINLGGKSFCPDCIGKAQQHPVSTGLENFRTLHGEVALYWALLPLLLFWPVSAITAVYTIYYSIKHWNSPGSLVGSNKGKLVAAVFFAVLQLAGWVALAIGIAEMWKR